MSLFTPVQGIIGGSLIGGSAGVMLVLNGDIMGCSGILNNSLTFHPIKALSNPKNKWRYAYLASFAMTVNVFVNYLAPPTFMDDDRSKAGDVPIASTAAYLLGGLLVGLGTKIGNGCTTGHGICGLARFSKRSLTATCTFTGFSMLTTFLTSPLRPWATMTSFLRTSGMPNMSPMSSGLFMAASVFAALISPALSAENRAREDPNVAKNDDRKMLGATISGSMFAAGLAISGMVKASKVHDFLCLSGFSHGSYDPTLMTVMGSGILASWLSYQLLHEYTSIMPPKKVLSCPAGLSEGACFSVPTNTVIDGELFGGAATFGIGWGLTGICPGPAIFAAASGNLNATLFWLPAFVVGAYVGGKVKESIAVKKKKKTA